MELLEIIGNINDLVWKWVFDFSKPISDNVAVVIIVTSFLVAVLAVTVRRCLLHRSNLFFIPEGIFLLSVSYMVHRLPMIHERLHTALSTAVGILQQSDIYTDAFEHISGTIAENSRNIARYLYFSDGAEFKHVQPEMLYEHLFGTLDEIRNLLHFWAVHENDWVSGRIFLCILVLFIAIHDRKLSKGIVVFLLNSILLLSVTKNNGAIFAAILVLTFEATISAILDTPLESDSL